MAARRLWRDDDGLAALSRLTPWQAAAVLAAVAALVLSALAIALAPAPRAASSARQSADARLYEATIADVARGEPYYQAAPRELRRGGYPLRPFMAIRPPVLTVGLAELPGPAARRAAVAALALAVFAAWAWRLRELRLRPLRHVWALTMLAGGLAPAFAPQAYVFHELWAGLLIALSLAVHRPRAWAFSLAFGLAAGLVRELSLAYLAAMAVLAWLEGRRGEGAAWTGAIAVCLAVLAVHAQAATAATTPLDLRSPGWLGLGGWPFVLRTAQWNAVVCLAPAWLAALMLPLALLGLLGWSGGLGRRAALAVLGYFGAFCVVGRSDNFYWGLMIAPLWPLGLMAADVTARRLYARAISAAPGTVAQNLGILS